MQFTRLMELMYNLHFCQGPVPKQKIFQILNLGKCLRSASLSTLVKLTEGTEDEDATFSHLNVNLSAKVSKWQSHAKHTV